MDHQCLFWKKKRVFLWRDKKPVASTPTQFPKLFSRKKKGRGETGGTPLLGMCKVNRACFCLLVCLNLGSKFTLIWYPKGQAYKTFDLPPPGWSQELPTLLQNRHLPDNRRLGSQAGREILLWCCLAALEYRTPQWIRMDANRKRVSEHLAARFKWDAIPMSACGVRVLNWVNWEVGCIY